MSCTQNDYQIVTSKTPNISKLETLQSRFREFPILRNPKFYIFQNPKRWKILIWTMINSIKSTCQRKHQLWLWVGRHNRGVIPVCLICATLAESRLFPWLKAVRPYRSAGWKPSLLLAASRLLRHLESQTPVLPTDRTTSYGVYQVPRLSCAIKSIYNIFVPKLLRVFVFPPSGLRV